MGWLVLSTIAAGVFSEAPAVGGVAYRGQWVELVKRVDPSPRSVIHGESPADEATAGWRYAEAQRALDELGQELDRYLATLRQAPSPYPLAAGIVLPYRYLTPRDYSPANGRLYVMYVGELDWPFPAPLVVDFLRMRVSEPLPQALHEVLTVVLRRWGRDHIEGPQDAGRSARISAALAALAKGGTGGARAGHELSRARLGPAQVLALKKLLTAGDPDIRAGAVNVLGGGGWLADPVDYVTLLADGDPEVRHAACWALLTLPGGAGLRQVRAFAGRREVLAARLREAHGEVTGARIDAELAALDLALDRAAEGAPLDPSAQPR